MPRSENELSCAWADHDYAAGAKAAVVELADMIRPQTDSDVARLHKFIERTGQRSAGALRVIQAST